MACLITCISLGILGVLLLIYFKYPKLIYLAFLRFSLFYGGLKQKSITVGRLTYSYAEKGVVHPQHPSIVFVHGFSSSKESWGVTIKNMPSDVHMVVVDMPGHGNSSFPDDEHTSMLGLTSCLHEFVSALGLQRIHIVGLSMGGAISGYYASLHSDRVTHCTMICPAMLTPTLSVFQKEVNAGQKYGLVPDTIEGMEKMMSRITHKPQFTTRQILVGVLQYRQYYSTFLRKLKDRILEENQRALLVSHVSNIKAPVQIIWGDKDELLDVSGAELLQSAVKGYKEVHILPNVGHSIDMERPKKLAHLITNFRAIKS